MKPYIESKITLQHLTLSFVQRSKSRSLRFRSNISRKGAEVDRGLQLNINRKAYMGSPLLQLRLTLVTLKVNIKVTQISKPYIS